MNHFNSLLIILSKILNKDTVLFTTETRLLGEMPEFDSIAVVNLIAELESSFRISIYDDEIDASVFESVGSLLIFIQQKTTTP